MTGTSTARASPPWPTRRISRRGLLLRFGATVVGLVVIGCAVPPAAPSDAATVVPPPRASAPTMPEATLGPPSTPRPTARATQGPTAPPTLVPTPARVPVDVTVVAEPEAVFAHELTKWWCAPAGIQIVLAIHGVGDTSKAFQRAIAARVHEFDSRADSRNLGWGPAAMVGALTAYGVPGYEVRVYETREEALRAAARAISETGSPAILLAWRGAHTWVMAGYRADADPELFADAVVEGAYILDPWYPSVSSIWGPSDPPGAFQDTAEMVRNYLPWKRPEGRYPERDRRFVALIPTLALDPAG